MTSQKTSNEPPGYRGALPSRKDRLARPWILLVIGIFVLVIVLSVLGIPSRFIPEPTPVPLPSLPASSAEASPSASASASAPASAFESASPSAEASASASESPSPTP
jgi:cytoskeletal protein RodZ